MDFFSKLINNFVWWRVDEQFAFFNSSEYSTRWINQENKIYKIIAKEVLLTVNGSSQSYLIEVVLFMRNNHDRRWYLISDWLNCFVVDNKKYFISFEFNKLWIWCENMEKVKRHLLSFNVKNYQMSHVCHRCHLLPHFFIYFKAHTNIHLLCCCEKKPSV